MPSEKAREKHKKPFTIRLYTRFFSHKMWELRQRYPKGKRFFPYCYLYLILPWALVWRWLRHDWRLFIVFGGWCAIVSCEVWIPYLLGLIFWGTPFGDSMWALGSACWLWWAGPMSPFMGICLALTIATEAVWKAIGKRRATKKAKGKVK